MTRLLRAPTYRQNPEAAYNTSGLWPLGGVLVVDGRHTPPSATNQAIFLQPADEPMRFIVGTWPAAGATNVPSTEELRAHLISAYTATATIKVYVNGVEVPGHAVAATHDGLALQLPPGATVYRPDTDGLVHVRVEGTEDFAGAVFGEWTFTPAAVPKRVSLATGQVPIFRGIVQLAAGIIPILARVESLATGQIPVRAAGGVFGEATGRIVVGEFRVFPNGSGTLNVAEIFRSTGGSGTAHVHGYAVYNPASGSLEISGPIVNPSAGGTLNVQAVFLNTEGSGAVNVGVVAINKTAGGSLEVWGEQSGHSYGRLLIRVSPLPPAMITELEKLGIVFE